MGESVEEKHSTLYHLQEKKTRVISFGIIWGLYAYACKCQLYHMSSFFLILPTTRGGRCSRLLIPRKLRLGKMKKNGTKPAGKSRLALCICNLSTQETEAEGWWVPTWAT